MPDEFYIYLGVYFLLAIIGLLIQERDYLCKKKGSKSGKKDKKGKKGGHYEGDDIEEVKDDDEERPLIKKDKKHKK